MIRTAECVTPKHPDKMCDRIADAILTEAIGVPDPVMTECIADGNHVDISHYNLTPKAIIDALGLRDIDYEKTAEWGHFGIGMPWDK